MTKQRAQLLQRMTKMDAALFTDMITNLNSDYSEQINQMTCLRNLIDDQFVLTYKFFKKLMWIYFIFYLIPVGILFQNQDLDDWLSISFPNLQNIINLVLYGSPVTVLFIFFMFEIVQIREDGLSYFTSFQNYMDLLGFTANFFYFGLKLGLMIFKDAFNP